MKRLIILIFFILLIFNCKREYNRREYNRNKIEKIEIDPEKEKIGYLSKICDTLYYLQFETIKESLIDKVDKIIFYNDKIFIMDKKIS